MMESVETDQPAPDVAVILPSSKSLMIVESGPGEGGLAAVGAGFGAGGAGRCA